MHMVGRLPATRPPAHDLPGDPWPCSSCFGSSFQLRNRDANHGTKKNNARSEEVGLLGRSLQESGFELKLEGVVSGLGVEGLGPAELCSWYLLPKVKAKQCLGFKV